MPRLEYRLTYHRPQPGTRQIPFRGSGPFPVYVSDAAYLNASDFASAECVEVDGCEVLRVALTPGGREKINNIGAQNQKAQEIYDYVGLLLHVDGKPVRGLTMVYEPIAGYSIDIGGLSPDNIRSLLSDLGNAC